MPTSEITKLEIVECPLCGTTKATPYLVIGSPLTSPAPHEWQLQRCTECALIFLNPRPTEQASSVYYESAAYLPFSSAAGNRSMLARLYALLRTYNLAWKRRLIERMFARRAMATRRLLDVGCGTGEFLDEMRGAGWETLGLERDANAAQFARDQLKLRVVTGAADHLSQIDARFDVITLWHVLEHLYHPVDALKQVARLLHENGIVLIAVPNIGGIDARTYKRDWVALDAPRHVQHFTLETLQAMAAAAGLKLLRANQLPSDAFFNTLMSEKLQATHTDSSFLMWPLRLARSILTACISLLAGSRLAAAPGKSGATLVGCFVKSMPDERTNRE